MEAVGALSSFQLVHAAGLLGLVLQRHPGTDHFFQSESVVVDLDILVVFELFLRSQVLGPRLGVDVLNRDESPLQILLFNLSLVELVLQFLVRRLLLLLSTLDLVDLIRCRVQVAELSWLTRLLDALLFICFVFELLELRPLQAYFDELRLEAGLDQLHVSQEVFDGDSPPVLAAEHVCVRRGRDVAAT